MTYQCCEICRSSSIYQLSIRSNLSYVICRSCRHALLVTYGVSMQDIFKELQEKYYGDQTALINTSEGPLEDELMAKRRSVFRRYVKKPQQVLEVGPGAGSFLRWAIDIGHRVTAIEESQKLAKALGAKYGASVHVGSFEECRLPDASQDVFCSFHVIEHVPDPITHLVNAARIVKPGGLAFIATPNASSWEQRLVPTLSPNFDSAHLRVFSLRSLCELAEETGWSVVCKETPEYTQGWLRVLSKTLRKFRGEDEEATAGKYGSRMSSKARLIYSALRILSIPLRTAQSSFLGGDEIFIVLHRD